MVNVFSWVNLLTFDNPIVYYMGFIDFLDVIFLLNRMAFLTAFFWYFPAVIMFLHKDTFVSLVKLFFSFFR